jgi:DNA recombination protein RmuC
MLLTLLLVCALIAVVGILIFVLTRSDDTSGLFLKQQLDNLQQNFDASNRAKDEQLEGLKKILTEHLQKNLEFVQTSSQNVENRLTMASKVVGELQNKMGKVEEATARVFEVGKNIASLQEILRAPKLRGSLGELFLGDLLAQVLPRECYELQYGFKSGEKVDAIIRSAQGMISVDSKFPLENFRRVVEAGTEEERKAHRKVFLQDVKKHIDVISKKYILPDEGTLDIALMYIPAENVYYEIILKSDGLEADLLRYAQERRVFPVSPNSFYAYLQTISIGLKGLQIEKGIRDVQNQMEGLKKDFGKFGETFSLIGKHLGNARGSFETAEKQYQRLGDKFESIGTPQISSELRVLKGGEDS